MADPGTLWGDQAPNYAKYLVGFIGQGASALVELVEEARPYTSKSTVLDEGAGTGAVTEALVSRTSGIRVDAIDISAGMLDLLRAKNLPNVTTKIVDGGRDHIEQGLEASSYTHALSSFVVQFIPDHQLTFNEMFRVLEPGGVMGVTAWQQVPIGEPWNNICKRLDPTFEPFRPFAHPIKDGPSLENALSNAGCVEIKTIEHVCIFEAGSAETFATIFMDSGNPPFNAMQSTFKGDREQARIELIKEVRDNYNNGRFECIAACARGKKP